MEARAVRCGLMMMVGLLAGCITPWNTRLPRLAPSHPAAERLSYQRHDPFPEEDLGPEMHVRPREYIEPRPAPRRAKEGRAFLGMPGQPPVTGPVMPPPSSMSYPNTIRE